MARPLRVEFPGAVYHVMARGNERREIYRDDEDRRRFLQALATAVEQFGLQLHAYCLMPNHYHLVLGTPQANLSRAMGWLQTTYTARFNARHRRSGHLFQGRFKAQLVEADEYAQWLVEYVHLNPVRPRRREAPVPVERAAELDRYEWSSHRAYAGLARKVPSWLCLDWRGYWGRHRREATRQYRRRMQAAFGKAVSNPWERLERGLVLGGAELLRRSEELLARKGGQAEARWTEEAETAHQRERVRRLVASEADPSLRIWARVRLGQEQPVELAREHGYRSVSGITMLVKRLEERAGRDVPLRQRMEELRNAAKCE